MRPGRRAADDRSVSAHPPAPAVSTSARLAVDRDDDRVPRPALGRRTLPDWSPSAVVALSTVLIGVTGVRGADYPAHFFRALVWERSGASVWNNLWYAGHA